MALTLSELMLTTTGVRQAGRVSAKTAIGTVQPREEVTSPSFGWVCLGWKRES